MKKRMWHPLLIILITFSFKQLQAQEKLTFDKVYSVKLRNAGSIIENEQIKGYYFFFISDKIDKRTNEYTLQIIDANLNKLNDIKFTDSKKIYLLESSFNGNAIVFTFYDDDQNMLDYRLYDLTGKKSYNYSKMLDKKSETYFKSAVNLKNDEDSENQNIFDISGKGFLAVIPIREGKKYSYEVNYYSSEKRRQWTYNPITDDKLTTAMYLGGNDSIALLEVASREKLTSKEMEVNILGLDLNTGKKVFEVPALYKGYKLMPMNMSTLRNNNEFVLMGPYYAGDDRVMQDKSVGLGVWVVNNKGNILNAKYNSWATDIGKYVKTTSKGQVEDIGYVFFHKVVQTDDGKIFAVGEGYKRVASAGGIILTVLTQSYSNVTKLKITDMMLFELNDKFEVKDAKIYEKNNNNFEISGGDFVTPHTLALLAKTFGYFDYAYTQMGKNQSSFMSAYTDYERSKDYKGLTFNSISYYDGKITNDKINLKTEASSLRVMPAKPGFVMIAEYYRKKKQLDVRLEKIN